MAEHKRDEIHGFRMHKAAPNTATTHAIICLCGTWLWHQRPPSLPTLTCVVDLAKMCTKGRRELPFRCAAVTPWEVAEAWMLLAPLLNGSEVAQVWCE
jgi:hypothetical protein